MSIDEIRARLSDIVTETEAIAEVAGSEERELNERESNDILALDDEAKKLEADLDHAEKIKAAKDRILARKVEEKVAAQAVVISTPQVEEVPKKMSIPAVAKRYNSKNFASAADAYTSGQFLLAQAGNRKAKEFMAAQSEGVDADGGHLVPDPLAASLVNLLEDYGVARRVCRRIVMSADTWSVPRLLDHAQVSYPGEAQAISDSDLSFSQIKLTATKVAALVKMSTEVAEDSIVSLMDTVVQSMAYSISKAEDTNLFNGVAGGINADGIKGDASVANVSVTDVASLSLSDLISAQVALGNPVVGARNEWYINPTLFHGQVRELLNAAGGNTSAEFQGEIRPMLLGAPVNFVNVLPGNSASASGDLLAVYGDMSLGVYMGDRRALNFKTLNELYANTDQIGVQCTERVDIKVALPEVLTKLTIA